jgi:protein-tyrosine-phosphatase
MPPDADGGPAEPFAVLFVCTGNICRSPTAEALARRELER